MNWAQRVDQPTNTLIIVAAPLPQTTKPPVAVARTRGATDWMFSLNAKGLAAPCFVLGWLTLGAAD
ncbi:MAG: hypothetical protein ACYCZF_14810 [Anaerolineae bacterium]